MCHDPENTLRNNLLGFGLYLRDTVRTVRSTNIEGACPECPLFNAPIYRTLFVIYREPPNIEYLANTLAIAMFCVEYETDSLLPAIPV